MTNLIRASKEKLMRANLQQGLEQTVSINSVSTLAFDILNQVKQLDQARRIRADCVYKQRIDFSL